MDDLGLKQLLISARTIAVVGHSDKPWRDSYRIAHYLRAEGYQIYPVNPNLNEISGLKVYPSLAQIPVPVDIVDVFRASDHVPDLVTQTIAIQAKSFWTQLGVTITPAHQERLAQAGIGIVENLCIKVEHQRLSIRQARP